MLESQTPPIRLKFDHLYLPDDPILRTLRASPDLAESISALVIALPRTRLHQLDIARFAEIAHLCDQLRYLTIKSARNVLHCAVDGREETQPRLPVENTNLHQAHGWTMTTRTHITKSQLDAMMPAVLALADYDPHAYFGLGNNSLLLPPIAERIVHQGSDGLVLRISDPSFAHNITTLVLGSSISGPVHILDFGSLGRANAPFEARLIDTLTEAELPNLEQLEVQAWGASGMLPRAIAALVRRNGAKLRTLALPAGRMETRGWLHVVLGATNRALRTLILDITLEFPRRMTIPVHIEETLDVVFDEGGLRGLRKLELKHSWGPLDDEALQGREWMSLTRLCCCRRVLLYT